MDIILRGELDGIETTRQVLQKDDLPVIFLTTHSDMAMLNDTLKARSYEELLRENQLLKD